MAHFKKSALYNLVILLQPFLKNSKFGKAVVLSKILIVFVLKRQIHIYSIFVEHIHRFKLIYKRLWKELIIHDYTNLSSYLDISRQKYLILKKP